MSYQQRPNSGALFKNHKKEPGSTSPDYRGDAEVNGTLMEMSAWIKKSRDGTKTFMSIAFKPKQAQQFSQMRETVDRNVSDVPAGTEPESQETIPF